MSTFVHFIIISVILIIFNSCSTNENKLLNDNLRKTEILTGLDVLVKENFKQIEGKNVGIIINHSSIDKDKNHILKLLWESKKCTLKAIFTPEHGFTGTEDAKIGNSTYQEYNLPIYSLYGETKAPTKEMLEGIDLLIFDIQDVGMRYYTYISTMAKCMISAKENQIAFMVLDRPNPLGGNKVFGNIPPKELTNNFVSIYPIPTCHGMTIGELAKLFNNHFGIDCNLDVIQMQGWNRKYFLTDIKYNWVNPSPNLRNMNSVFLYSVLGPLEGCNLSVGRGTDEPFQLYGAPWIDECKLFSNLSKYKFEGVKLFPACFVPKDYVYKNKRCFGIRFEVTNYDKFDGFYCLLVLLKELYETHKNFIKLDGLDTLIGYRSVKVDFLMDKDISYILAKWEANLKDFLPIREKYLLYK